MAPSRPTQHAATDQRVHAVIEFASRVIHVLKERIASPKALRHELEASIKQLPALNIASLAGNARQFDALGTELWNASAGLLAEEASPPDPRIKTADVVQLGVHIRIFALLLLDTAHTSSPRRSKDADQQLRVLKVALKAARLCLDKNELGHAQTALQTCSQYTKEEESESLMQLAQIENDADDRVLTLRELTGEYFLLRLLHSWKSDRPDLANLFYSKLRLPGQIQFPNLALKTAVLFYDFAKSLSSEEKRDDALKWYERAFSALAACRAEALDQDSAELLLSIGISFIEQLLNSNLPTGRHRAWGIFEELENVHGTGNRITVPLTKFRLLASEPEVNDKKISHTLVRLANMVVLTEDSFKMIMQTIRKALSASVASALTALRSFIDLRLVPELESEQPARKAAQTWLEKATISYIMYATTKRPGPKEEMLDDLQEVLDSVARGSEIKFTTKATHAAQTLLWKAIGDSDAGMTYSWCHLLKHALFENAGSLNKARIGRKLMRAALDEGNMKVAHEAFTQMPLASQNECLTRYMAFRLALRTNDEELAMSSLNIVTKAASKDTTYLFACVLEAQQSEMKHMAVAALQAIIDQRPASTHLPSLLRCTARLLIAEIDIAASNIDDTALQVINIFETATKRIDELRTASGNKWRVEVQWWSKNTYNLAIRLSACISPELLVRLLDACAFFLDCYPNDTVLGQQDRIEQRKMLCAFLATTAVIVLGRSSQKGEAYTLQCFLHAKHRIDTFKSIKDKLTGVKLDDQDQSRIFAMLKFELECILRLQQWHHLDAALRSCLDAQTIGRWDTLADLLIIVHGQLDDETQGSHTDMMTQLLQRIINDTWKKEKEIGKVARWLRFTFSLCLDHRHGNFSFKLLEQAAGMAENGERGKHGRYPDAELQWLATTGFNHAIDLLVEEKEEAAVSWMDAALALARWAEDNGSLHEVFTSKKGLALERARER